jgi:very-short-patch-repair endonuclease
MGTIFNNAEQTQSRRFLRKHLPKPEVLLWKCIHRRKITNAKFRRQHGIGPYIVDFYCPEVRLAIEIDGLNHTFGERPEYDASRTAYLQSLNVHVVRFSNDDVLNGLERVLHLIQMKVEELRKAEGAQAI